MPRKYLILAYTFLFLILSGGTSAETEREAIINHTQNATWAYHTENDIVVTGEHWYISLINATTPSNVYSLGLINNGQAAWWTVGTGVATFNSTLSNISFAQYLDNSTSDTFWVEGLKQWGTNSQIHSDRQKLQGKTVRVKWYFFQAPNGAWYIVNAPGYGATLDVRRFAEKNGQYDWPAVDMAGINATFFPSQSGNGMTVSFAGGNKKIQPIAGSLTVAKEGGFFDANYNNGVTRYKNGVDQWRQHLGTDFIAAANTTVVSISAGTVIYCSTTLNDPFNSAVIVQQPDGVQVVYGHIYSALTKNNATGNCGSVEKDQSLGYVQPTNSASASYVPHVHMGYNTKGLALPSYVGNDLWGWGRAPFSATRADAESRGWVDINTFYNASIQQ